MDVLLIETGNGGDLVKKGNDLAMIYGFENMPYLALFGGNKDFPSSTSRVGNEQAFDWWGNNLLFPNDSRQWFSSLTETALHKIPLTSSGRLQIESAIKKDLEFMGPFAEVKVATEIISTDHIKITIGIKQPDNLQEKEFIFIWDATKAELTGDSGFEYIPKLYSYLLLEDGGYLLLEDGGRIII